jgi:hypothetical protein
VRHWFLPDTPDLLGLLVAQADTTILGMDAFAAWSAGDAAKAEFVRAAEHDADTVRRELQAALRAAFSTPLDAEDIYELSERLDAALNAAKNAVREAEVMQLQPNGALAGMASELADGIRHIRAAFAELGGHADAATASADAAIKCERNIERSYREAMSHLLDVDDLREVIAWREMYGRYARVGECLVQVAERVWYAVVKER